MSAVVPLAQLLRIVQRISSFLQQNRVEAVPHVNIQSMVKTLHDVATSLSVHQQNPQHYTLVRNQMAKVTALNQLLQGELARRVTAQNTQHAMSSAMAASASASASASAAVPASSGGAFEEEAMGHAKGNDDDDGDDDGEDSEDSDDTDDSDGDMQDTGAGAGAAADAGPPGAEEHKVAAMAAAPIGSMPVLRAPQVNMQPYQAYALGRTLRETIYGKVKHGHPIGRPETPVAVKLSELAKMNQNDVLESPDDEVKVMAHLSANGGHINVLRLLDVCRCAKYHWTVLEFCSGGEFFDIIATTGKLDDRTAWIYFSQLVEGTAFIHAKGMCHLDLSLENCLLDRERRLKICDFGMARVVDPRRPFPGEQGNKPGKLGYMAPEVFAGEAFNGFQADIFCIGVILFIMLTGTPPFNLPSRRDARFNMIFNGQLAGLLQRWGIQLDVDAVDLLQRILAPANVRLTMAQIRQHAWMKKPRK